MLSYILLSVASAIGAVWLYRKMTTNAGAKYDHLVFDSGKGVIYMLDKDIDTKFSLGTLVNPIYNAFDKPHEICEQIGAVPKDVQIKLVISTKGGSLTSCEKIVKALKKHPAGYVAYICEECYSAGAIIALGAEHIVMGDHSYIGKIDPQHVSGSSSQALVTFAKLEDKYIDASNAHKVIDARNVLNYMDEILAFMFQGKDSVELLKTVKKHFIYSLLPHAKLFDYKQCQEMDLHVRRPTPDEESLINSMKLQKSSVLKDGPVCKKPKEESSIDSMELQKSLMSKKPEVKL